MHLSHLDASFSLVLDASCILHLAANACDSTGSQWRLHAWHAGWRRLGASWYWVTGVEKWDVADCCSHPTNLLRWRGVYTGLTQVLPWRLLKQIKLICSVLSHPIDSAIGAWDIIIAIFREQVWYPSTTVFKCEGAQMCGVRDAFLNDSGGAVLYGGFLYRLCCSHDVTMPFWVLAWFQRF